MATLFKQKCEQYEIPFYFKVGSSTSRDDKIVIYSDTDNISKYIGILKEIAKEKPELINQCGAPPVLTGKIDDWIGIGDEPPKKENGENTSYNKLRARIIENSIEEVILTDIESLKGQRVTYNDTSVRFNELFIENAINVIMEKLEKESQKKEINSKLPDYGIRKNEVYSDYLKQHIKVHLGKKIQKGLNRLNGVKDNKENMMISNYDAIFKIPTRNEKGIDVNIIDMDMIIKRMIPIIKKIDPSFIEKVQQKIEEKCNQSGIDFKTFCFQKETIQKLQQNEIDYDDKKSKTNQIKTNERGSNMEYEFNKEIIRLKDSLKELDEKAPRKTQDYMGQEGRQQLKEFEREVRKHIDDIIAIVNNIKNKDKKDLNINAQEMDEKLTKIKKLIIITKGKYDYSGFDDIEFLEEIEDDIFSLQNILAKVDPFLANYRIDELANEILQEEVRLQNKNEEIESQWYFPDHALMDYEKTKKSQLGKLISNFEDILFSLDKDDIEIHSKSISKVLNIKLPKEVLKEDENDLQNFIRNRDMILRNYNKLELDSKINIEQQGEYLSSILPKQKMDKPTMELCNLCQMVKNSPNVDIKGLIGRYYNSSVGSTHVQEIHDGENIKFYINKLQELTDEITKKDNKLGKEFYDYIYSYTMEYVGLGFMKGEYKSDDFIQLYKDVCSQVKEYNEKNQDDSSKELMNDIYSRYFQEYIMQNSHNSELVKAAQGNSDTKNALLVDAYKNIKKSDLDKSLQTIQNTKNERNNDKQQTEYRF